MNLFNPYYNALRQHLFNVIGNDNYTYNEMAIDQLTKIVQNDREFKNIGQLINAIYESGYLKAIEEHKAELQRLGLKVTIKDKPQTGPTIFNQKNQSVD